MKKATSLDNVAPRDTYNSELSSVELTVVRAWLNGLWSNVVTPLTVSGYLCTHIHTFHEKLLQSFKDNVLKLTND